MSSGVGSLKSRVGAVVFAAAGCLAGLASAQESASSPSTSVSMLGAERHLLRAQHIDQTFAIDVLPILSPLNPPAPGAKLPVVYVLDGNIMFPMVASTAYVLSLDSLPSMLVVGIGYDLDASQTGEFMLDIQARRNRDFLASVDEAFLAQMVGMYTGLGRTYPSYGQPGGAADFLAFINDELKPFLAERYPNADPEDATVVGDSFGGSFALYALFNEPESFDRYVAGSPGVFWDDRVLLTQETASADVSARLFMSVGSDEPADQMVGPIQAMDAQLRDGDRTNLQYTFHVFEDENHASVLPATFSRGLRAVFE